MKRLAFAAALAALPLAACGGGSPAENHAEQLREAADQSTPRAADVLENAADRIEEQGIGDPAAAQRALERAGDAQVPPPGAGQQQGAASGAPQGADRPVGSGGGTNPGGANAGGNIEGPNVGGTPNR